MEKNITIGEFHRRLLEEKSKGCCPVKKYKLLWLIAALAVIIAFAMTWFQEARFNCIIIHHTASKTDNYASIKRYHKKKGLRDAAYHLVLSNGSTEIPLGNLEPTGRYLALTHAMAVRDVKYNLTGLHLCIVGNYETNEVPGYMKPVIAHAVRALQNKFGIPDDRLLFHRDVGKTKCPGKYLTKKDFLYWVRTMADQCPASIAAQQNEAIAAAPLSGGMVTIQQGIVMGAALLFFALGWIAFFHILSVFRQSRALKNSKSAAGNCHPLLVGITLTSFNGTGSGAKG